MATSVLGSGKKAAGGAGWGYAAPKPAAPAPALPAFPSMPSFSMPTAPAGTGATSSSLPALPSFTAPPPNLTNRAETSPELRAHLANYQSRLTADPTQRAIDRATSAARDAGAALKGGAKEDLSRRGILDSGIRDSTLGKIDAATVAAIGRGSADIAMGREKDLDALVMGGTPLVTSPQQLSLAERGLGLEQYKTQQAGDIARLNATVARETAAQNAFLGQQNNMLNLWQLYASLAR